MHDDISVLHAIAGLNPRSGGPSRVVVDITDALALKGDLSVTLLAQSTPGEDSLPSPGMGVNRVVAESPSSLALALGVPFRHALQRIIKTKPPTLLHTHGLWLPLNHWATSLGRQNGIPVVLQPHGMLQPWALAHKPWKKRVALALFQRSDLVAAQVIVATSAVESDSIRKLGYRQPIAVIPNGVPKAGAGDPGLPANAAPNRERIVLFLSRVHPLKGLLNLVAAWAQISPPGWKLRIVGPDEGGHLRDVQARVQQLGIGDSVVYIGNVDSEQKAALFRGSDLFVLPTFTENFGVVIAEALAHGLPVITTRGAPWADLEAFRCGWWVDIGVAPLVKALQEAMALSDKERWAMGARGRDYVRRYDWDDIAQQTMDVYRWVLGRGSQPDCVRTD